MMNKLFPVKRRGSVGQLAR